MKQIIIINGVYGHHPDAVTVETKKAGDPPFSVSDAEAARLVGMGVAQISGITPAKEPEQLSSTAENEPEPQPGYSAMKVAELKQLAIARGLDVKALKAKKDFVKALEEADASGEADEADEDPDEIEDDEPAPSLAAADPV